MARSSGRNPVGRPSMWTPEVRAAVIKNTRTFGLRYLAANLSGISERLLYEWLQAGNEENPDAEFVQFAQEVEKARAEYIARKWGRIEMAAQASPQFWVADMTQLERMDPARFGRRFRDAPDKAGAASGKGEEVDLRLDQMSEDDLNQLEQLLSKATATKTPEPTRPRAHAMNGNGNSAI